MEKFGPGFISIMNSSPSALVSSLISNGHWSIPVSNDYRAITFRTMLDYCPISNHDLVLWNGESSVNMRVIWESIRRRSSSTIHWLPLIWHKFHIPSCSFITWLACRERLLTKDRMEFFHMHVDQTCVLCRSYNETTEHLFSVCPYTYLLIRACPFELNINWQGWIRGEFFQETLNHFQQNIGFLYINVVIYLVWRERNDRIHGKSSQTVDHLLESVKRMVREKLFTCAAFRKHFERDPTISQILY